MFIFAQAMMSTLSTICEVEAATEEILSCNGQLIYRERRYGIEPDRRCEVFVGRVPRDSRLKEDLVPIFKQVGRLLEFRLLVSFSGHCRGFGFAIYATREEAEEAINRFNNFEIRKKWFLGVCWSLNKCKISLSHLPYTNSFQEIAEFVFTIANTCGPGDEPVYIVYSRSFGSRGCTVVWEHKTHRAAALNRKNITGPAASIFGPQTQVTWVDAGLRIDVDTFPFMATRQDKNSPVIISRTDLNIVNMFDIEETRMPLRRQIRKGDSREESYSSTFDMRNAVARSDTRVANFGEESLDLNVEWSNLPESLTTLFGSSDKTPAQSHQASLLARRNAHVPHIEIGNPAEPTIDINVNWKNRPALVSLLSSTVNHSPKVYSPANYRALPSAGINTPISSCTTNTRFTFDNLAAVGNSTNTSNYVAPITPASSGYGSQEDSPCPMFASFKNCNLNNTKSNTDNKFIPSYYNRQMSEHLVVSQPSSGSPWHISTRQHSFDMSYFSSGDEHNIDNTVIWRENTPSAPSVDSNFHQTPGTSANSGTTLQQNEKFYATRDGMFADWTSTSLWDGKRFY